MVLNNFSASSMAEHTVYPFIVCTRLRVFVIIFAEMLARQTEAGRGAVEGFSKPCKPFSGILYKQLCKCKLGTLNQKDDLCAYDNFQVR